MVACSCFLKLCTPLPANTGIYPGHLVHFLLRVKVPLCKGLELASDLPPVRDGRARGACWHSCFRCGLLPTGWPWTWGVLVLSSLRVPQRGRARPEARAFQPSPLFVQSSRRLIFQMGHIHVNIQNEVTFPKLGWGLFKGLESGTFLGYICSMKRTGCGVGCSLRRQAKGFSGCRVPKS